MIYGMSWLYGLAGSLDYMRINAALAQGGVATGAVSARGTAQKRRAVRRAFHYRPRALCAHRGRPVEPAGGRSGPRVPLRGGARRGAGP